MFKFSNLIFAILCLGFSNAIGQDLPQEMRFSEDGKMLLTGGNPTEGLYDESQVRTISLNFDQANYWAQMTNNYEDGIDIPATMTVDGIAYDSVGVRFKGATSYFRNDTEKKSFNISLDYVNKQDLMGYKTLNLNCNFDDESAIREVLFNHIGRQYSPSLKSNFVNLEINGENWGPYANVQQLNGDYLKEWFLSNDGSRIRALDPNFTPGQGGGPGGGGPPGGGPGGGPPGGGGQFGTGVSTLNYLGDDIAEYEENYTMKSSKLDNPWEALITACEKLNTLPLDQIVDSLDQYIDVDKALWFLAHEIVLTDEDSYVWKGGMDYYVYTEVETNRIIPLEYDGNSAMLPDFYNWSPFYNEDNEDYPLMNILFAVPELRQRYLAHVRTILNEYLIQEEVEATIDGYVSQLDQLVQNDPKKMYSHQQFLNGIEEVKEFITNRRNFLLQNGEVNAEGCQIKNVTYSSNGEAFVNPTKDETVIVTATIESNDGVDKVWLYHGAGFVGAFSKVPMFDDGTNNDETANDGIYTGEIPTYEMGTYVRYYVEAIADNDAKTATYEPQGAQYDVFIYRVEIELNIAEESDIVINELMASNDTIVADEAGEYDDWFELYNTSDTDIDISGYFLTDKIDNLDKWELPEGTVIKANDYLVVWADEDSSQGPLHANFKLSANGEILILLDPDFTVMDEVSFGPQQTDTSYARSPNGTGEFVEQAATFAANNDGDDPMGTGTIENTAINAISIYPNPAKNIIYLKSLPIEMVPIWITDPNGKKTWQGTFNGSLQIDVSGWSKGIYFISVNGSTQKLIIGE